jgi:hypothetical protein
MKHILVTFAMCILVTTSSHAQIAFGIKGGIKFATVGGADAAPIVKSRTGFAAGAYMEASFPFLLTVQPEMLYTTKGFTLSSTSIGQTVTSTNTYSYIEIPVLVKFSLPVPVVKPKLYIGPEIGFLLSAENKYEATGFSTRETNIDSLLSSTDIGVVFGASAHVLVVDVDVRYDVGLRTTIKNGTGKVYNRTWSIMVEIPLY